MLGECTDRGAMNIGFGWVVTIKDVVRLVLKATGHDNAQIIFSSTKPTIASLRTINILKAERLLYFKPIIDLEDSIFL